MRRFVLPGVCLWAVACGGAAPEGSVAPTPARPAVVDPPAFTSTVPAPESLHQVVVQVGDALGRPVAGASLRARGIELARTGPDGVARFDAPGVWRIAVEAEGFAPAALSMGGRGAIGLRLLPEGVVTGRVVDGKGQGVGGVVVWSGRAHATTGPDGAYALRGLGAGAHQLAARGPGYSGRAQTRVVLGPTDVIEGVEVPVRPGVRVEGRVRGMPPGAAERLHVHLGGEWFPVDEAGRFIIEGVRPGEHALEIQGPRLEVREIVKVGGRDVTARLDLPGLSSPEIRTVSLDGEPLGGVLVRWRLATDAGSITGSTYSDASGVARPGVLPEGRLRAYLVGAGVDSGISADLPTADPIHLTVPHRARLAGTLVDAVGRPIRSREIRLLRAGRGDTQQIFTDDRGAFVAPGLEPGDYRILLGGTERWSSMLQAALDHTDPDQLGDVDRLKAGETRRLELVASTPIQPLRGVVVDGTGTPVEGAVVTFGQDPVRSPLLPAALAPDQVRTGTDGAFTLWPSTPGQTYRVVAFADGTRADVRGKPGDTLQLRMEPRGQVRVAVHEPTGVATVQLRDGEVIVAASPVDPVDREVVFAGVPARALTAHLADGGTEQPEPVPLRVEPGKTARLSLVRGD